MLAFGMGVALALLTAITGKLTGFDKDRSFYPTILMVIASYYILFSLMGGDNLMLELLIAGLFGLVAIAGGLVLPVLVGVAILCHGLFDWVHVQFIANSGVPLWWPAFCGGFDVILGVWVIALSRKKEATA